jgi:pimeloyl-ACP methyl ester carboxylesterase
MRMIGLNGWLQKPKALTALWPEMEVIDYLPLSDENALHQLLNKKCSIAPDLAIGWSLGAVLLLRALPQMEHPPRFVVLIAPAFRGSELSSLKDFQALYRKDPARGALLLEQLIQHGNSTIPQIKDMVRDKPDARAADWLDILLAADFSAPMASPIPTLLIQGDRDAIIPLAQARSWMQRQPHIQQVIVKGSGHAPHLHRPDFVRTLVEEFINA